MMKGNNSVEESDVKIDIEKVIYDKSPALLKALPGFIIQYLKKILHQDELNLALEKHGHLTGLEFIDSNLKEFGIQINVKYPENIPLTERAVIASNHPLGGPDGLTLLNVVGKYRTDIKFIVNDILLNVKNLKPLFLPVNKHGRHPREAIKIIESAYASDLLILTFPFGLVSRKRGGEIKDLVWHKNFVNKAKQHKRDIIPTFISGRNSNFFYRLANLRKFLRIKANIEMLYLVDEMYKQIQNPIEISFGKAIDYSLLTSKYTDAQWAEKIRKHVYDHKNDLNVEFSYD